MAKPFRQEESLAVRLKGILSEYPPGISIFKELLQNADDAGAKVIIYTLDTRSYPKESLVDQGLADHQGPALRVYNDAVFSDNDLTSLQNLGNSLKKNDNLSTGKFGLGFNAVYGWTDTPCILTGKYFIAFCPHDTLVFRGTGLIFDFVEEHNRDISNQLAAFGYNRTTPSEEFPGTMFRIPFRTPEQAKTSLISDIAITPDIVLEMFEEYQTDVIESLVFLKNIERIEFYLDDKKLGSTKVRNLDSVRNMRASVAAAISSNSATSHGIQFDIEHEYIGAATQIQNAKSIGEYQVQQRVFDPNDTQMSEEFKSWTTQSKSVGVVALSARLNDTDLSNGTSVGRVFVTLPLPIPLDNTRVNINSMFALRRDRRSLWTDNDADGGQTMNEILWNNYLVRNLVPVVWHDLLVNLTKSKTCVYEYFPLMPHALGSLFNTLAENVLKQLLDSKSAIWRLTTDQYMPLEMGFIAIEKLEPHLLDCLNQLKMPIFADIPDTIVRLIQCSQYPHTILTPEVLRHWLRENLGPTEACDMQMAMHLLEYVSKDERMDQLFGLPLFACRNGRLRSLSKKSNTDTFDHFRAKFYIGTADECALFDSNGELFLLIEQFPQIVATRIRTNISMMSASLNFELFSLQSFKRYMNDIIFSHPTILQSKEDSVQMSICNVDLEWIQELWSWLDTQDVAEVEKFVQELWLIPLEDGKTLHKIKQVSEPLLTQIGDGQELIFEIFQACTDRFPLVEKSFKVTNQGYLRSRRRIVDVLDLEGLLNWITPERITSIENELKDRLREHILLAGRRYGTRLEDDEKSRLAELPVFKNLVPNETHSGALYRTEYVRLPKTGAYPVVEVPCVPDIPNAHFFDATLESDQELYRLLGYPILTDQKLLEQFIIENFESQDQFLRDPLIEFIFDRLPLTGRPDLVQRLSKVDFVKVCDKKGRVSVTKLQPPSVIDRSSGIAELYFDSEQVFGSGTYDSNGKYYQALRVLGMRRDFDADIATERIKTYHDRSGNDDDALYEKCGRLLTHLNSSKSLFDFNNELLDLIKLPAIKSGKAVVLSPTECRPISDAQLVEGVLGIVDVHVEPFLATKFGWNSPLDPEVISSRISVIALLSSSSDVQLALFPVLEYLNKIVSSEDGSLKIAPYIQEIDSNLGTKAWLPGSKKGLWSPDHVFFNRAGGFEPYMSDIPAIWSKKLENILQLLKVTQTPTANHLFGFLASVRSSRPLSEAHMNATIDALQRLESDFQSAFLKKLLVPDVHGELLSLDEFLPKTADGAPTDGAPHVHYAHSRVSHSLALKCGIPQFPGDIAEAQYRSGPDFFKEYSQEESIVNRITNTIKESSLWSSLNEFVANAEDCGTATKTHWILDSEKSEFPSKTIICDELEEWQTPALYFYNDGVFTDSDFKALIDIGMGSKVGDSSKIGKYGLGSLTMYLFTDVPSMISGEYFIIFDPTRQYLPFRTGQSKRQAGIRLELSQMRPKFCDQLEPFVGIGGYTLDIDKFQGTIFRFPIRTKKQYDRSPFALRSSIPAYDVLRTYLDVKYCDQARRSLIMVKRLKYIQYERRLFTYRAIENVTTQIPFVAWTVTSQIDPSTLYNEKNDDDQLKQAETYILNVTTTKDKSDPETQKWVVVKGFLRVVSGDLPEELKTFALEERFIASGDSNEHSVPDVGIAAQFEPYEKVSGMFYNSLPFEAYCGLPVNFHGRFAMSPDRRSLRTDSRDGEWNKYLAKVCLPKLYCIFLERLLISPHGGNYYAFWPAMSILPRNEISSALQSAFWEQMHLCPRKIFLNSLKIPVPFSLAIFDARETNRRANDDPVASIVAQARPGYAIVNNPVVIKSLNPGRRSNFVCLTPEYVRGLLREESIQAILNKLGNGEFKSILLFVLDKRSTETLDGCYIFRTVDGRLAKVAQDGTVCGLPIGNAKRLYIVDNEGFRLFKDIGADSIISPAILDNDILSRLALAPAFNVRKLDGTAIDIFVPKRIRDVDAIDILLRKGRVKTFGDADSAWLLALYNYVVSRKFTVNSYEKLPMLPLSNKGGKTFVSMTFWKDPRLLPPINDPNKRRITDLFPDLHILADLNFTAMQERTTSSSAQRFLGYLHNRVKADARALAKLCSETNLLTDPNIETLKTWLFESIDGLSEAETTVLKHLPIWKVWVPSTSGRRSRTAASSTVSAVDAFIVPKLLFLPRIHPAGPYVVEDRKNWLKTLRSLGAKDVNQFQYISDHLVPYILAMPPDDGNRTNALRKVLNLLSKSEEWRKSDLAKAALFPNRNGELCRAVDLYDPSHPVFRASFGEDGSKFPERNFAIDELKQLGLNVAVTQINFKVCLESFEREYQTAVPETLWQRAGILWKAFSEQSGGWTNWSTEEREAIPNYHFVPIRRAGGYRHGMPVPATDLKRVATMKQVTLEAHIPIVWTQKSLPDTPPATWIIHTFNFSPKVEEVVGHLVALATVVAPRCRITEDDFYADLKATYQSLIDPGFNVRASQILKQQYPEAGIWLNDDATLETISLTRKPSFCGILTGSTSYISSLLWLPANHFVQGISYDPAHCKLHPIKASLTPYQSLIHSSGMNIVRQVAPIFSPESTVPHNRFGFQTLQALRSSEDSCDYTIIVDGKPYHVHLVIMAIFSGYFLTLMSRQSRWKESRERISNFGGQSRPGPSTAASRTNPEPYATPESVQAVIDWIYKGELGLDDRTITDTDDTVYERLDHYMDILKLADRWDIVLLKKHVENRILNKADLFIRIEIVRGVREMASQCNANELEQHCRKFEDLNKAAVDRVQILENAVTAPSASAS